MKNKLWISALFVLMVLGCSHKQALEVKYKGFITGNRLVELIRNYDEVTPNHNASLVVTVDANSCIYYIMGVFDATRTLYDTPENVTAGQVVAVVSKFLKENPERWNEPAANLVIAALKKAFPKKEEKKDKK